MRSEVSVVAIVAAYNEADVIGHVVSDLIGQGVQVYFLDDGSTDGTVVAVEPYVGRGVVAIERMSAPVPAGARPFEWERILHRKTALARVLEADWFIHHDADEFRESPWPHLTLKEAIGRVDALGFNAIDFQSLDFWPVDERFQPGEDVRNALTDYAASAPYDRLQIRCWKKTSGIDLASTGGHEARFPGRKVFPLRFIMRHYPIRGQAHGERKIFAERQRRFLASERARGWHVQYDAWPDGASFTRDPSALTPYDPDAVRIALALRHRGVEELEASVEELRSELARTCASLEARRQDLERAHAERQAVQATLDASRRDVAALHDVMRRREDEARREAGQWRLALEDATRRIEAFEQSLSWRCTAPLRAVYRLFRRHA